MKRLRYIFAGVLSLAVYSGAQMIPGQQPGMGQPSMGQPGMGPGMGGNMPGMGGPIGGIGQPNPNAPNSSMNRSRVDDQTLDRQVHEQLRTQADLSNVHPRVENGVVYLEGSVPDKKDRKQAEKLVHSIPGVMGVKDKLKVEPTTTSQLTGTSQHPSTAGSIAGDTQAGSGTTVAGASGGDRSSNPGLQGTMPQSSSNATATTGGTSGSVAGQTEDRGASNPAQSTIGSLGTPAGNTQGSSSASGSSSNQGGMTAGSQGSVTADSGRVSSSELQEKLNSSLWNNSSLAGSSLSATVTDEAVDLQGSVRTGKQKEDALRLAHSYASNRKVIDHVTVVAAGNPPMSSEPSGRGMTGSSNPGATGNASPGATGNTNTGTGASQPGMTTGTATGTTSGADTSSPAPQR